MTVINKDGSKTVTTSDTTADAPFPYAVDIAQNPDGTFSGSGVATGPSSTFTYTVNGKVSGNALTCTVNIVFNFDNGTTKAQGNWIIDLSGSISGRTLNGTANLSYSGTGSSTSSYWTQTASGTDPVSIPLPPALDTIITAKPPATTDERNVSFTYNGVNGNGGIVGYYYTFDTNPQGYTTQTTLPFSNLAIGNHTFTVAAKDAKGNVDLSPAVWSFTVTKPNPTEGNKRGPGDPANEAGDPINIMTGNMYVYTSDIVMPGRGINFDFSRTYNSRDTYAGPLGYGWTHSYNIFVSIDTVKKIATIRNGQGKETLFSIETNGTFTPQRGEYSTFTKTTSGYTWRLKTGINFYFDATGKLLKVVDRNANTVTLTYNTLKQLASITDTVGRKVTLAYDTKNRIISATNPLGKIYKYAYDANNNLVSVTDPKLGVLSYAYDANHNLIKKTLPTTKIVTFTYDTSDRCTSSSRENNYEKVTLTFEPQSKRTIVKNSRNYSTTYYYNTDYQLIDVVDSHNNHVKSTWDTNLNLLSRTDALGRIAKMEHDAKGNLIKITDPLGKITTSTYEATFCNPISMTDALGKLTTYTYDTKGNLIKVVNPLNIATTYQYTTSGGLISSITNAAAKKISFTYNTYANIASITDLAGIVVKFSYDAMGNKVSFTDPRANVTKYSYDELNRLIKINLPDKVSTNLFTYDAMDNLLTATNALGKKITYTYDAAGKPLTVTNPAAGVITNTYDSEGNLLSVKDQKNNLTKFTYDELNLLITKTDSANYKWNYFYDANSNRVKQTDPKGQAITYAFDELNRLKTLSGPDVTVRFSYDALGRVISMIDWQGTTNYTYDVISELLKIDGPLSNDTVTYAYDTLGNRKSMLDPDNKLTKYAYDAANRLISITDPQNLITKYTYDTYGNLATSTYPNKTGSIYKYDSLNRLGKLINQRTATPYTKFSEVNYSYDTLYRKTKAVGLDATHDYTYDVLSQLTQEKRTSANTPYQIAYTYDAAGNRLTMNKSGIATAYTYNNLNQLTKETTGTAYTNYYYDLNGNLIKSTPSTGAAKDLLYDCLNRLNKVTATGLNEIYKYDGGGNRVQISSSGVVTNFLYDGSNSIIERNASQVTNRSYVRNPNSLGGIGGIISQQAGSAPQYYHYDSLGSVVTTSNPSSVKLNSYAYDSFGNIITSTGSTPNNRQFLTKEQDKTGFVYFGARYYDPKIGRFITPDPLGFVDGPNPYLYCNNDPINFIDAWGMCKGGGGGNKDPWWDIDVDQLLRDLEIFSNALMMNPGADGMIQVPLDQGIGLVGVGIVKGARYLGNFNKKITVIGHMPDYIAIARKMGANYLKPIANWSWRIQGQFIKEVIRRGDDVFIATPIREGASVLKKEIKQLIKAGYRRASPGSNWLIKE